MPYATARDGAQLYYEETGKGTPIVFVHEFSGDLRSWEAQMRYFSRRYRCIAFNARGYPPSDVPKSRVAGTRRPSSTDDIAAVMRHLKIAQGAHRRLLDGRLRHAQFRHSLRRARAVGDGGRRRRRFAIPDCAPRFCATPRRCAKRFRDTRHAGGRRIRRRRIARRACRS